MRKVPIVICCMLLVHASVSGQPREEVGIDQKWLDRLRTDGKAALERYQGLAPRLEELSECQCKSGPGGDSKGGFKPHFRRERVVRRGDNMIVEKMRVYDDAPDKPDFKLECDNSDYEFTLWKKAAESPYALLEWKPGKRKYPLANNSAGMHGEMIGYLKGIIDAARGEPKYSLRAITFDGAREWLRVEWEFDAEWKPKCTVWVDPSHDWRVVDVITETVSGKFTHSYTYGAVVDGLAFPTASKFTAVYKASSSANMEISTKVTSIKITDKADADFRLSAFGLPEPMGMPPVNRDGTRWYIWISLAALAIVVLFFMIQKLLKRYVRAESVK